MCVCWGFVSNLLMLQKFMDLPGLHTEIFMVLLYVIANDVAEWCKIDNKDCRV